MSGNPSDELEDLRYRRDQANMGGGIKRLESIRQSGRGTARERIRNLLDLSLIHISSPRDQRGSRMPSSA